jgi:hypothetical protein
VKIDRTVCDNHPDREAVATYIVGALDAGERVYPVRDDHLTDHRDLCSECAAVLGWAPITPAPETEEGDPVTDAQRRLIFARCHELGIDEDARHALLERVTGDPSMRNLRSQDVDAVVRALDLEEAGRV